MRGRILVVDDERLQRWALRRLLADAGHEVFEATDARSAMETYSAQLPDLVLLDLRLGGDNGLDVLKNIRAIDPGAIVIMLTAHGALDAAVTAFKGGLFDFVTKPYDAEALKVAVRYGIEARRLRSDVQRLRESDRRQVKEAIIGSSPVMRDALAMLARAAAGGARTVLLTGESGTGKDLFAKAFHYQSSHPSDPFVPVNCAAIPDTLLESELFGHEKGAFTDARFLKKGVFELADGGTLYLDEIGELRAPLQAKLLRVLESLSFRRVGGTRDISVNVRIVAATNQDLDEAVAAGRFRPDLLYRLRLIEIVLPPLREHPDDIPALVKHFIAHFSESLRKQVHGVTEDTMNTLRRYQWPGNVRELRNAIERAAILQQGELISPEHLPVQIRIPPKPPESAAPTMLSSSGISLARLEDDLVKQALESSGGNQSQAARLLGIGRHALRYKLKKLTRPKATNESD